MAAKSQTSTAAFKAWFGNSKVVDGRGRPLRVFHGTAGDFTQFDPEKVGTRHVDVEAGTAFFFTPSKDTADYYAQSAGFLAGGGANVMPVYLSMQNPLDVDFQGTGIELLGEEIELAKQRGHDGLIARNYDDGVLDTHYIVFSPEQVKSAIGNVGSFEIDNPDLRFSVAPVAQGAAFVDEVSTPDSVRAAIAQLVRVSADELTEGVGAIVVATSEGLQAAGQAEVPAQRNAALQAWFGDSKVVDSDGKPLVVYHGTVADFSIFSTGDVGFHFGTLEQAENRLGATTQGLPTEGENLMPVHLSIKNPLRMPDVGDWGNPNAVANRVGDMMVDDEAFSSAYESAVVDLPPGADFRAIFERMGYDGIVYENTEEGEGVGDSWIAFRPEQIKSATGNRGTYDPKDPDIRHSLAGLDERAQAWHDAGTNTTVFLADRIAAGQEAAVFLHETVHRHGRQALPEGRWDALVGQVKAWAQAQPQSPERAIHDAAAARVATAGVAGALADEELFAYAVEEAVARGIEPSAAAVEGSAHAWLQAVVESIQRVADKLLGNDLQGLAGQDLVDLAYALAQLDSPEHGVEVRKALLASEALASALAFRIESRDGPSGQSNLRLVAEAQGIQVGCIDYSVYRGDPAIEMIHVDGGLRRRGIGKAMAIRIQMEYPDTEIRWGGLTSDGAKLYESIPKTFIPDREFVAKREELLSIERKLAMYAELGDQFHALVAPTDDQRAAFLASVSDWNDLHDAQGELERYVAFTAPGKTILCAECEANQEREFEAPITCD